MYQNNQMGRYSPGGYMPGVVNLANFQVNRQTWETLRQSLYDSNSYPASGVNSLSFFAQPVGQGTGIGGGAKTLTDTNMVLAGQLPANQMFLVEEIEVLFQPSQPTPEAGADLPSSTSTGGVANIVNDAYIFYRSGNFQFTIGSKRYLTEAPLVRLPPQSYFEVEGGSNGTDSTTFLKTFFAGARGQPYIITPNNLLLVSSQNFDVLLAWPEGLQAITNPALVYVVLNGFLYRKAQ